MSSGIIHIALRSLRYYRKPLFQQLIIIALLSAVITGSILTGYSVRENLKNSIGKKLGKTGFIVSSGLRYFSSSLSDKISKAQGIRSTAILESDGFTQNFSSGARSLKTKVYGVSGSFFTFQDLKRDSLKQGEVAINMDLASKLKIKAGDDIILTMTPPDDIPAGSPFAPSSTSGRSGVFRVAYILSQGEGGDFSTGISQMTPDNLFLSSCDPSLKGKVNRILIAKSQGLTEKILINDLKETLAPEDIELTARSVKKTNESELISSRIFIDQNIVDAVRSVMPESQPIITYLANSVSHGGLSAPYSFIAGIGNNEIPEGDNVIVNEWLAKDINVRAGDTVSVSWYAPAGSRELEEKSGSFVVRGIASHSGIWADSTLMPEFPGIAGSKSCTDWDAGIDIKMDRIRKKDEDYWNRYGGTPKAFISYNKGRELWGNNFGPATAIRFPSKYSKDDIIKDLTGRINPGSAGFTVVNIYDEMIKAADKSVDFGTLFLSLGFFIIVSCIVILMLAVSSYFDSRKKEVSTFKALGFRDRWIRKLLFLETGIIALSGSAAGGVAGLMINNLMIHALNSVWMGAVQTTSLKVINGIIPLMTGTFLTFLLVMIFLYINIVRHLRKQVRGESIKTSSSLNLFNKAVILAMSAISALLLVFNFTSAGKPVMISFISGAFLFLTLIFITGFVVKEGSRIRRKKLTGRRIISGSYYAFHPEKAIMPVLLIAAGLFAIVITGVNRLRITDQSLTDSGGTGGYKYWIETSVPVREDLNGISGRKIHGLEGISPSDLIFVQGKRAAGNDASCLNLNFIATPPLLGIDPSDLIKNRAFSFSSLAGYVSGSDPWSIINKKPSGSTIFGFADQSVLEWGLRKKTGDTLKLHSESGELLNVVIAGGLKPSLFQGYLVIGADNFNHFNPSVPGFSVFLARGSGKIIDSVPSLLSDRLENYGITIQNAPDRLASFFAVTNTFLSVFTILGLFGMILGVIGLGFVLNRNYTSRRKEFAFMISSGFRIRDIKRIILEEQVLILIAGIITGLLSGLVSTSSSVSSFGEIPWVSIIAITVSIAITGIISLLVSLRGIRQDSLITDLRRE
ncbi:MAG: FtsX-like permease family protein [Bacteroidales bacterium]|jgi:ABC-type antimicrobial peptide transport system permease subunit